jgi:hypothetical protein
VGLRKKRSSPRHCLFIARPQVYFTTADRRGIAE